jgi:hypothetical protein
MPKRRGSPKWKDLEPDPRMIQTLDTAGAIPFDGSTSDKRNWGKRFADSCAVMFANELRPEPTFRSLEIRPFADGTGQESLTGVGGHGQKKVDVIASTLASGLQIALSLKAENFPDSTGNYGKNLKNRLYELQDEVRAIHEYQPRAYVVGVFFLPLDSTEDRAGRSSFTRAVANLRSRSDRTDFSLVTQWNKLDWSIIGLYVPEEADGGPLRGVVRYFDVMVAPPERGRPKVETTMAIEEVIAKIAKDYVEDAGELTEYAEPEAN